MDFQGVKEQASAYIAPTYGRVDLALVKGENATAWDMAGKKYIDFTSGIGVNALGYSDPGWAKAVAEQAGEIQHISNYYYHPKNTELAEKLAKLSGLKKSFFSNSGAEANECAIKAARKHGESKGAFKIITLENSFHGRTITTLAATGQENFHQHFQPLTPGFVYARANDLESVRAQMDREVCAVMVEMVQGEGGVVPLEPEFVKGLYDLCEKSGILLIVDEVQTGIGRTGKFFAYQNYGILPDIATCAKGVAGGLPMGVCMLGDKVCDILQPGMQGSTFGGNPVACAGALEVLSRLSAPGFLEGVQEKAEKMWEALLAMPQVTAVYGKGMMVGIEVQGKPAGELLVQCVKQGLLILTAKTRVRFLPPLTITAEELAEGLAIFQKVLEG